ncbi:MAG: alkaline phosphatase family protein, partial [Solirubrobacterales bacterium]
VESIAKADPFFAKLVEASGDIDEFLARHAVILLADHAQTPVHRGLPVVELLERDWTVLRPSESQPERCQLAVSPTSRAAHVYLLPGEGERADPDAVRAALGVIEGVDLVCRLEGAGGEPLLRNEPGLNGAGQRAVVERGSASLRFSPGVQVADLAGATWQVEGDLGVLEARVEGGLLYSDSYPNPLGRVWSALNGPHAGDFILSLEPGYEAVDWGGVSHAGGGSHGSLHAGDSLGPLLFVGCGPNDGASRPQWTLRDVAPVVLDHFGLR